MSPPAAPAAALSLALPMSDAAITATAMTAMKIVHTALISGFTPSRTSE